MTQEIWVLGMIFKIEAKQNFFIEVKGLSDISGGILFTNKEWITAKEKGVQYYLCIVSDISNSPQINFIQDPSNKLNPAKNIYPTIQISWSVTQNQLAEIK